MRFICTDFSTPNPQIPVSGDKDVSLLCGTGEYLSHGKFIFCFQGRRMRGGGQSDLPASAIVSNSFSLRYSVCQGAKCWVSCPKPQHWMESSIAHQLPPCIAGSVPLSFLAGAGLPTVEQLGMKKRTGVWSQGDRGVNSSFAIYYLCDLGQVA